MEITKKEIAETLYKRPELQELFALLVAMDEEQRNDAMRRIEKMLERQ